MNDSLITYGLNVKIFAYVKNEGNNLTTMTIAQTFVISYKVLKLTTPFIRSCWGHAMSKCCQYAIDDIKICVELTIISIKKC